MSMLVVVVVNILTLQLLSTDVPVGTAAVRTGANAGGHRRHRRGPALEGRRWRGGRDPGTGRGPLSGTGARGATRKGAKADRREHQAVCTVSLLPARPKSVSMDRTCSGPRRFCEVFLCVGVDEILFSVLCRGCWHIRHAQHMRL